MSKSKNIAQVESAKSRYEEEEHRASRTERSEQVLEDRADLTDTRGESEVALDLQQQNALRFASLPEIKEITNKAFIPTLSKDQYQLLFALPHEKEVLRLVHRLTKMDSVEIRALNAITTKEDIYKCFNALSSRTYTNLETLEMFLTLPNYLQHSRSFLYVLDMNISSVSKFQRFREDQMNLLMKISKEDYVVWTHYIGFVSDLSEEQCNTVMEFDKKQFNALMNLWAKHDRDKIYIEYVPNLSEAQHKVIHAMNVLDNKRCSSENLKEYLGSMTESKAEAFTSLPERDRGWRTLGSVSWMSDDATNTFSKLPSEDKDADTVRYVNSIPKGSRIHTFFCTLDTDSQTRSNLKYINERILTNELDLLEIFYGQCSSINLTLEKISTFSTVKFNSFIAILRDQVPYTSPDLSPIMHAIDAQWEAFALLTDQTLKQFVNLMNIQYSDEKLKIWDSLKGKTPETYKELMALPEFQFSDEQLKILASLTDNTLEKYKTLMDIQYDDRKLEIWNSLTEKTSQSYKELMTLTKFQLNDEQSKIWALLIYDKTPEAYKELMAWTEFQFSDEQLNFFDEIQSSAKTLSSAKLIYCLRDTQISFALALTLEKKVFWHKLHLETLYLWSDDDIKTIKIDKDSGIFTIEAKTPNPQTKRAAAIASAQKAKLKVAEEETEATARPQVAEAEARALEEARAAAIASAQKAKLKVAEEETEATARPQVAEAEAPAPVAGARFLPNVRRMGGIHALPAPEEGGAQARARNHGMSSVKIFHESLNVALVNSAIKASIPAVNNVLVSFDIPQEHSRYLDRASPVCAFGITKFAGKLGFATPLSAASFHVVNHGLPETLPEVGMLAGTFVGTKVIAKGVDLLPPQYRMPINIALILGPAFIARNDDMSLSKTKTEILQDLAYENSQPLGAGVIAFGVATGFGVATSPALAVAVGVGLVSDYAWTAYDKGDIATMPSSVESAINFAEDYEHFSHDIINTAAYLFDYISNEM